MLISIILVNYHSSADLIEAIDSVEKSLLPKDFTRKIIVVENGSPNQNEEIKKLDVLKKYNDIEIIISPKNTGFTGGHNLGIKRGQEINSDYFLLLNPDTKVDKNFLTNLLTDYPTNQLSSPKIYFYPGFEFHKDRYKKEDLGKVIWYNGAKIDWQNMTCSHLDVDLVDPSPQTLEPRTYQTDFCTGCCLLIPKQIVDTIGLLDQKLFFSWEDVDYSLRAQKAGFKTLVIPNSIIWHKNAHTSGGAGGNFQDYYQTRNRLIIAFRCAPLKTRLALLKHLLLKANLNRLKAIILSLFA